MGHFSAYNNVSLCCKSCWDTGEYADMPSVLFVCKPTIFGPQLIYTGGRGGPFRPRGPTITAYTIKQNGYGAEFKVLGWKAQESLASMSVGQLVDN